MGDDPVSRVLVPSWKGVREIAILIPALLLIFWGYFAIRGDTWRRTWLRAVLAVAYVSVGGFAAIYFVTWLDASTDDFNRKLVLNMIAYPLASVVGLVLLRIWMRR